MSRIEAPAIAGDEEDVDQPRDTFSRLAVYLLLGIVFGIILIKSEVVSWFRVQEMFRFDSFHMYGVLGSAVAVAGASLAVIRKVGIRTSTGEPVRVPPKALGRGYRYLGGGTLFGLGWALTGACPGPILALVGNGITPFLFVLVCALIGTRTYGEVRARLPH